MSQSGFGYMLQQLREKHKLSLRELAQKASVDHVYIHRLESGENDSPSAVVVENLSLALEANARDTEIFRFLSDHQIISAELVAYTLGDETITPIEFAMVAAFVVRGKAKPNYPKLLAGVRSILQE